MKLARLALAAALAFACAAHAQTMLGGKSPLAFPYFINQPGSYKLAGNLVVPSGQPGIVISVILGCLLIVSIAAPMPATRRPFSGTPARTTERSGFIRTKSKLRMNSASTFIWRRKPGLSPPGVFSP